MIHLIPSSDRSKFEKMQDNLYSFLRNENWHIFPIDDSIFRECIFLAKRNTKTNNRFLKENDNVNHVTSVCCKDIESGELVTINLKAKKERDTKYYFLIELLKLQYAPRQLIGKVIKNIDNF